MAKPRIPRSALVDALEHDTDDAPAKRRARRAAQRAKPSKPAKRTKPAKPARPAKPSKPAKRRRAKRPARRVRRQDRARARAEKLVGEVVDRRERVARDFYAMGEALRELAEPQHFRALGHESFDELLAERELMARGTANKLIRVAETYSRKQALELGLEKAYGLLRYARVSGDDRSAPSLAARNAVIGDARVRDITVRALADETRRARGRRPHPPRRDRDRVDAERRADRIERALRRRGAKDARVTAVDTRDGWRARIELDLGFAERLLAG